MNSMNNIISEAKNIHKKVEKDMAVAIKHMELIVLRCDGKLKKSVFKKDLQKIIKKVENLTSEGEKVVRSSDFKKYASSPQKDENHQKKKIAQRQIVQIVQIEENIVVLQEKMKMDNSEKGFQIVKTKPTIE